MVAVASAAVVFNVVLGLCLHGACCTGLPHGHSHGHGHSAHTRLIEEPDSDHVHVHPKASPGQVDQFSVLFLCYVTTSVSDSESGFRRAKMTHRSRKNYEISCFEALDVLF
jgi:hypothetical protein